MTAQPVYRFVPTKRIGGNPAQGKAFEVQMLTHGGHWDLRGWVQQPSPSAPWCALRVEDARVGVYGRWARTAGSRMGAWHFAENQQYA
jgi:hypothetical protein